MSSEITQYYLYSQCQYLPSHWLPDNFMTIETMLFGPQTEDRISGSASICSCGSTLRVVSGPLVHLVNFVELNISHFKFSEWCISVDSTNQLTNWLVHLGVCVRILYKIMLYKIILFQILVDNELVFLSTQVPIICPRPLASAKYWAPQPNTRADTVN